MQTLERLNLLCRDIAFEDWVLRCGDDGPALWLQWRFLAPCAVTKEVHWQSGRKWRISHYATSDEIVKTAFAAAIFAIEHEAREQFTYKGEAIFHPHTDVEALVEIARQGATVQREAV